MQKGVVKFFNASKGFGFIVNDANGKDVFFHRTGLIKKDQELKEGQKVTFEIEEGKKGPLAVDISRA